MGKIKDITLKLNKRNPDVTITPVAPKDLPTLITKENLDTLTEGDENPFFFAQAIQFPVVGNGDVYGEEFFKSFLANNASRAFPGSKYGHSSKWGERQPSHFYQIGGMIKNNVAYFKFYVPPETDSESNKSFIKEIKANGIDLSLVSKVSYVYNEADRTYYILSSEGSERNDAVSYGEGSMDQAVFNKNENKEEGLEMDEVLKKLNALILSGELSIPDLMLKLNKQNLLKSDKEIEDLKVFNSLVGILGDKPIETATAILKQNKENLETVREAALVTAFGEVKNADGTDNVRRIQGELLLANKDCTPENIEAVKKNSLFIAVAGKLADENSDLNKIVTHSGTPVSGVRFAKM